MSQRIHHKCRSHAPQIEVWEGYTGRWFWRVCDPANELRGRVSYPKTNGHDDEHQARAEALRAVTAAKELTRTRFMGA